jgi:hypothetical protein
MDSLRYIKAQPIRLKGNSEFNERWLQSRIAEDPGILGLGELDLVGRERRQDTNGRLDLLLADVDEDRRFEVEIMLGATDESHIIRCIEYWDIERRRYPQYDHCAVLIAEDITSRFLNVLGLFIGQIPLIVIQVNALQVDDKIIVHFVRVMDRFSLRRDDEAEATTSPPTDRAFWEGKASKASLELVDQVLALADNGSAKPQRLSYNRAYIGVDYEGDTEKFIYFRPKKKFIHVYVQVDDKDEWVTPFEELGVATSLKKEHIKFTIDQAKFGAARPLLSKLLQTSVKEFSA